MCGIVGLYYFDHSRKVDQADIQQMTDQIVHRGPDDEGIYVKDNLGLGMRRLSIIDLSGGHQPIFNNDGSKVIVFNGEVYNFLDHRPQLEQKGHRFTTHTDTEVVLHLYEEYGLSFFDKLNGMYGLAIWDDRERELLLARDRIGIKPLYYYQDEEKLVFASEIKAILALPSVKREIDINSLSAFFKYGFTPAPLTLFKGIKKIPPAQYLRVKGDKLELKNYWRPSYQDKLNGSEREIAEQLYALLKDSVRYRLISDVPLGAFLSGGMDSSGIVHIMSELDTESISTYSIGFGKGYEFYNELDVAGRYARDMQTNHHEILVEPDVVNLFPKLVSFLDEPLADSSFVVTYLVSQLARETVTVILSGVGGDELFAGYRRYLNIRINKYMRLLPRWLRKNVMENLLGKMPVDRNNTMLNYFRLAKSYLRTSDLPLTEQYSAYTSIFNPDLRQSLIGAQTEVQDFAMQYFAECDSEDPLDKITYFDLRTSLPEQLLMLTDKMSMATSLEARVPFLDHRLVEFSARIPSKYKINGFNLRSIQKEAFKNRLPEYILNKTKKGFGAPVGTWMRNELKDMLFDLLGENRIKKQGLFEYRTLQKILDDHFNKREDYSDHLLALITFQLWHKEYLGG